MYTADFETITTAPTRVWAWAVHGVGNKFARTGTDMESFIKFCQATGGEFWFHNLRFDGNFIVWYLLKSGFTHTTTAKVEPGQFKTIISDMGEWYMLRVNLRGQIVTYYDSAKVLPMTVAEMARSFNLPISKGEIDYSQDRPEGWQLTTEELSYIMRDVQIPAAALKILRQDMGMTKITAGSNAFWDLKTRVGRGWKIWFPALDQATDHLLRRAYKGGFTWANPRFKGRDLGAGIVLDVNSLYPSVMRDEIYPVGEPVYETGELKTSVRYPLYIQRLTCSFKLKKDKVPCIQLKNNFRFAPREWLSSSDGQQVQLVVTNVDLDLIKGQYHLYNVQFQDGWKFKAMPGLFTDFINYWAGVKIRATTEGNAPLRSIAKLMLNSCYGKFATNPKRRCRIPEWDPETQTVTYRIQDAEDAKPAYLPVGIFVTSYARRKTITAAQQCYDRVAYCDTDSLHLIGEELPAGIDVDPVRLGAWKLENRFDRARFLRAKCYIEETDGSLKVTVAGLPDACHDQITWDNFQPGLVVHGKLLPHIVEGGVVLKETEYTIKA